jgi:hypothetical protein
MHFGLYLKKKGIISAEQLVDALEAQVHALVPIGQLALEEGILSARDIFDVLRAQTDSPSTLFGELAVELGLMNRDELMRLLMIQAERKKPIVEILIWQGAINRRQATMEMANYRREQLMPRRAVTRISRAPRQTRRGAPVHSDSPMTAV